MENKDKKMYLYGKRFWNVVAKLYTPVQERTNRELYRQLAVLCTPYIKKDDRVLELACGTGQLTLPLWKQAAFWEATDYSEPMIRELSKRCPPELSIAVRDATALPYADGAFQVVLMANALHIMPQPKLALNEIHRILSSGGIFLVPTFVYEGKVNRLRMKWMKLFGFPSCHEWTMAELMEFVEQAGFRTLEHSLVEGDPLPEGFLAVVKLEASRPAGER